VRRIHASDHPLDVLTAVNVLDLWQPNQAGQAKHLDQPGLRRAMPPDGRSPFHGSCSPSFRSFACNAGWLMFSCLAASRRLSESAKTANDCKASRFVAGMAAIQRANVRFCQERPQKAVHCRQLGITHFIDDREDVLAHLDGVVPFRLLFGPQSRPRRRPALDAVEDLGGCQRNSDARSTPIAADSSLRANGQPSVDQPSGRRQFRLALGGSCAPSAVRRREGLGRRQCSGSRHSQFRREPTQPARGGQSTQCREWQVWLSAVGR